VLYILTVLAEVSDAEERFLAGITGPPQEEIHDAVEKLASAGFATTSRKGNHRYADLTNLGRSVFGTYWKHLKRCQE